jgi:hypothetical protein
MPSGGSLEGPFAFLVPTKATGFKLEILDLMPVDLEAELGSGAISTPTPTEVKWEVSVVSARMLEERELSSPFPLPFGRTIKAREDEIFLLVELAVVKNEANGTRYALAPEAMAISDEYYRTFTPIGVYREGNLQLWVVPFGTSGESEEFGFVYIVPKEAQRLRWQFSDNLPVDLGAYLPTPEPVATPSLPLTTTGRDWQIKVLSAKRLDERQLEGSSGLSVEVTVPRSFLLVELSLKYTGAVEVVMLDLRSLPIRWEGPWYVMSHLPHTIYRFGEYQPFSHPLFYLGEAEEIIGFVYTVYNSASAFKLHFFELPPIDIDIGQPLTSTSSTLPTTSPTPAPLPLPQPGIVGPVNAGGNAEVVIINDTPYELTVNLDGPDSQSLAVAACQTCSVYSGIGPSSCQVAGRPQATARIPPGDYEVSAQVNAPGVLSFAGQWTLLGDNSYQSCFFIVTQ